MQTARVLFVFILGHCFLHYAWGLNVQSWPVYLGVVGVMLLIGAFADAVGVLKRL